MSNKRLVKLGEIVDFNGETCVVTKVGVKGQLAFYVQGEDALKAYVFNSKIEKLQLSEKTGKDLPKKLKAFLDKSLSSHKKFDFVTFEYKGKQTNGTVIKGGSKVVILLEDGETEISGAAHLFKKIKSPVIEIPKELKDWSFIGYKEHKQMSRGTTAFNATAKYKNKKVLDLSNDGRGACMSTYQLEDPDSRTVGFNDFREAVESSVKALFPDSDSCPNLSDIDEYYVHWFNNDKKFNITWKQYLNNF